MRDVLGKMRECGKYIKMRDFPHDCGMVDTYAVRVWSLIQCPLKDIRFIYSFQEILESVGVRDQARFVEVSTTAVTRAMLIFVSTRCPISKNEAIRNFNFKRRGLICENMTKFQPSDVRRHQSEVVS